MPKQRPIFLDLSKIRLPLPAVVSILHRLSGLGLFLFLPVSLFLLHRSLSAAERFSQYGACLAHPFFKILLLGVVWALLHHMLAGVRFLLIDIHQGVSLCAARASAKLVLVLSLGLTVIVGGAWLW